MGSWVRACVRACMHFLIRAVVQTTMNQRCACDTYRHALAWHVNMERLELATPANFVPARY
eukprot:304384-Alexandrium_andersonii.AAC.1